MVHDLTGLPEPPFTPERTYRGLPVPYTTLWREGEDRPDFTAIDPVRVQHVLLPGRACRKRRSGEYALYFGSGVLRHQLLTRPRRLRRIERIGGTSL